MVALACSAPQLVQIWDCRQVPSTVSAAMSCDLPPRSNGTDAKANRVCAICCVPAAAGILPSQLVLGSESGAVYLWDLRKASALWTIAHLPERVLGCSASKCGSRIVMGTQQGLVQRSLSPSRLHHTVVPLFAALFTSVMMSHWHPR
jgi:hypothetical protein